VRARSVPVREVQSERLQVPVSNRGWRSRFAAHLKSTRRAYALVVIMVILFLSAMGTGFDLAVRLTYALG